VIGEAHIEILCTPSDRWDEFSDLKITNLGCKLIKNCIEFFLVPKNRRGFSLKPLEILVIDIFAFRFIGAGFCLNADYQIDGSQR
jgi:hypothetical protein